MFSPKLKEVYLRHVPSKAIGAVTEAAKEGRVWVRDHADNFATAARAATQKQIMQRYLELAPRTSETHHNEWGYDKKSYKRTMTDGGVVEWGSMHGLNVRSDRARWDGIYMFPDSPGHYGHVGVPLSTVWEQTGRPVLETHYREMVEWAAHLVHSNAPWSKWTAQEQANIEHWEKKRYEETPSHLRGDPYVF